MNGKDHVSLPEGTDIGGYRLLRVLGDGGFGITYLAENFQKEKFAIKEYLPNQFAVRGRDGIGVHPRAEANREDFEWGRRRFVEEADLLARFEHPNIVKVKHFLEMNNTAYIVMEYEDGEPLDKLLRCREKERGVSRLTEAELKHILFPIADGLRDVHREGVCHRDIKPANIFVRRSDGSPVLLDFGAARNALGRKSMSVAAIVSPPYSPPEQYSIEGSSGPYTDIYALSALCYRAITGTPPAESPQRQGRIYKGEEDPLPALTEAEPPGYSRALLEAVDWGLRLDEKERPQSVEEWLVAMGGANPAPSPRSSNNDVAKRNDEALEESDATPAEERRRGAFEGDAEEAEQRGSRLTKFDLREVFRKLVRGQYGLGRTYWLFGVLPGFAFGALDGVVELYGIVGLGVWLVWLVYAMYQGSVAVGVWRAGHAYQGPKIWPVLARGAVILGFATLTLSMVIRSQDSRIVFSDGNELTVANEGEETIYYIRVSVDHESQGWGHDLLAAEIYLSPGEEFATRLQQFSEDQCLLDVLVEVKGGRQHVYEDVDICRTARLVHPPGTFTLDNQSDVVIQRVLATPDYDETWHEDLLGPTLLPPGDQRQFDVGGAANHCVFDIRVEWARGLYREFRDRDLCEDSHVAFDGGRGLVVSNESRTEIAAARASPDFEDSWGPDRLGEDEIIAPGRERVIMLEERYKSHCAFDIRLTTLAGASVEYRGRNLCDDSRIVFSDGNELTVANEGEETVHCPTCQPFTVRTGPPDARIRIMNIGPRYEPEIKLPPGSYDVRVTAQRRPAHGAFTARDFETVERSLRHGDEPTDRWIGVPFYDCPVCPKMVELPKGSYTMGTSKEEDISRLGKERFNNEGPAHEVVIRYPLAVGVYEVSFDEWDACVADKGCTRHLRDEERVRKQRPVVNATLADAKEYANWLTARTGRQYRLLSEAEWEYAARAGTSSGRHYGVRLQKQCDYENGADTTAKREYSDWDYDDIVGCDDGYVYAAPSDETRFRSNPWGLHHMLGNVSEWTADCWHGSYKEVKPSSGARILNPHNGSAWVSDHCDRHVVRGGSWQSIPRGVRAPTRRYEAPTARLNRLGFRVAVVTR